MNKEIASIRKEYQLRALNETNVATDALEQFTRWWNEAVDSDIEEVNAMTLATATNNGLPSARIVLLKGFNEKGFLFFTNYNSHKTRELDINPHAALVFFWKELERQIRIEGVVERITGEESNAYFQSRPAGSRISAWASPQSTIIENRNVLEENVKLFLQKFGETIPRPTFWGGYRVVPFIIEFWQGRSNRLHDRIQYTKQEDQTWNIVRLAP